MKKPFYARVAAFSNAVGGRSNRQVFTINARITDGPDYHMDRPIQVHITSGRQARSLAESLLAWANAKEREGDL